LIAITYTSASTRDWAFCGSGGMLLDSRLLLMAACIVRRASAKVRQSDARNAGAAIPASEFPIQRAQGGERGNGPDSSVCRWPRIVPEERGHGSGRPFDRNEQRLALQRRSVRPKSIGSHQAILRLEAASAVTRVDKRHELWEERNQPRRMAGVMLGLGLVKLMAPYP